MKTRPIGKRMLCIAAALCMGMTLSGCSGRGNEELPPSPTLKPAVLRVDAPDGDRPIRQPGDYTVYYPSTGELRMTSGTIHLEESSLKDTAHSLVTAVLESVEIRGGSRTLTLFQGSAPEISGGICTVNLDPSALELSYSEYYILCVALATTLCSLDEITHVNVLTASQSVALDTSGMLAMGTLTAHPEENLPVLWEQTEGKRAPLGTDASQTPLSALATVYYPLTEGRGIGCETRMMNFSGQTANQLASPLLDALNDAVHTRSGNGEVPALEQYLLHPPVTSELEDGGKLVTVSFRENIGDLLAAWDTDLPCLIAAVACTLTTFIPGVAAVCFRIGDKPVTELNNGRYTAGTMLGGLVRRENAELFLTGSATVFYVKDGKLVACEKPMDRDKTDSPRMLLAAMLEGPDRRERENGLSSPMPEAVREDDILGISAAGDTLLVNLSEVFRSGIRGMDPEQEALLCYSMVNTLCLNTGLRRVCFFFEGEQTETVNGGIYWGGEFMYNPGF